MSPRLLRPLKFTPLACLSVQADSICTKAICSNTTPLNTKMRSIPLCVLSLTCNEQSHSFQLQVHKQVSACQFAREEEDKVDVQNFCINPRLYKHHLTWQLPTLPISVCLSILPFLQIHPHTRVENVCHKIDHKRKAENLLPEHIT